MEFWLRKLRKLRVVAGTFVLVMLASTLSGVLGCTIGDAVQPTFERFSVADGHRFPHQHEKGLLESVFGILLML